MPKLHPITFLISCGWVGFFPFASGTAGSAAASVVALLIGLYVSVEMATLILSAGAVISFVIGWWASGIYSKRTGKPDPSEVVIDEWAGQWTAHAVFLGAFLQGHKGWEIQPHNWVIVTVALFLLFRLFDIWKPGPIGWAERSYTGGLGIMLDDILAGIIAALVSMPIFIAYFVFL